jgi:hypothetical protein
MTTRAPLSARSNLEEKIHSRKASLTDVEMNFLHALLIDPQQAAAAAQDHDQQAAATAQDSDDLTDKAANTTEHCMETAAKVLDDDMLFSVPEDKEQKEGDKRVRRPSFTKKPKDYRFLVGLWQAHEDGVSPQELTQLQTRAVAAASPENNEDAPSEPMKDNASATEPAEEEEEEDDDEESAKSDQKVQAESPRDDSSDSSWDEAEGGFDHFDAWQVLKDEYASDFGFDYTPDGALPSEDDSEMEHHTFKILGTSAEDASAHPHVLSPPLMDTLINFVPDHLQGQNMWMKYSLVRDGASLDTFKRYVRAAKEAILAIETTKGEVFGCFTSSSWRTNPSFYGGAPSFVWKMRHNRNTPCHSLIEQANMEAEVDIFFLLGDGGQRPQCSTSNMIGLGEGNITTYDKNGYVEESREAAELKDGKNYGFAIALQDDLLAGTTSRCSSYKNPCFVAPSSHGESFEVLNIELWTFTPCFSLDSAEKLEMTKFFVCESIRNMSMNSTTSTSSYGSRPSPFSSQELLQDQFYRRVGYEDDEHEELRDRWQYRNMMDGAQAANIGMGASPRFSNAGH